MDVLDVKKLKIPDVKVVSYGRYLDERGYFSESARLLDIQDKLVSSFEVQQVNESYSKKGVIRGLHFQWNPYMGKLVRTITGTMYDIALDIRVDSDTFGKAIIYKMETKNKNKDNEWIWVPPGFAHGNFFTENTYIEYICTSTYAPDTEASISPLASDIDWSLTEESFLKLFRELSQSSHYISEKDRDGYSVKDWKNSTSSMEFTRSKLSA